jgi:hypothetical protein
MAAPKSTTRPTVRAQDGGRSSHDAARPVRTRHGRLAGGGGAGVLGGCERGGGIRGCGSGCGGAPGASPSRGDGGCEPATEPEALVPPALASAGDGRRGGGP